ncbi:MAG: glucosaminidase domain-containing protein [Desulfuromusa sp.]|nr:glucosaminidase domain-containing protein [Desulfuromusa sp.]
MNKYPFLSMVLIVSFFALLIMSATCFRPETNNSVPETNIPEASVLETSIAKTGAPETNVPEASVPEVSVPVARVSEISVQEKKAQFKSTIIPVINEVHSDLMRQYQEVSESVQAGDDIDKFAALRKKYKATNNDELLMSLKPHPQSIAIAQAAMESSWATSRFFKEANNIFGVWSHNENEARLAAGEKRGEQTIWVKKYSSVEASIRDYYRTLARGDAYKEFRVLKMETNDPHELVKKLKFYSERREEYTNELSTIIRYNEFDTYDQQKTIL